MTQMVPITTHDSQNHPSVTPALFAVIDGFVEYVVQLCDRNGEDEQRAR